MTQRKRIRNRLPALRVKYTQKSKELDAMIETLSELTEQALMLEQEAIMAVSSKEDNETTTSEQQSQLLDSLLIKYTATLQDLQDMIDNHGTLEAKKQAIQDKIQSIESSNEKMKKPVNAANQNKRASPHAKVNHPKKKQKQQRDETTQTEQPKKKKQTQSFIAAFFQPRTASGMCCIYR